MLHDEYEGSFTPYLEEDVAHGFCDRAINTSFMLAGRIGVFVCVHRSETKVTYAMPEDATPTEAAAAYEVGREQGDLARMVAEARTTKRKRRK